jgi:hypothetical protein
MNVLIAVLLLVSGQEVTTGSIGGRVLDPAGGAIGGAQVQITSNQGTRSMEANAEGRFYAPYLTPGTYSVRVEAQGFRTSEHTGISVLLAQRNELEFRMELGAYTEVVSVVADSGAPDLKSSGIGVTVAQDILERVPVDRQLSETFYFAGGVTNERGTGRSNPAVSGATGLENNYRVDGVNITDPSYGAIGPSALSYEFVEEIEIRTGGFEAEYGQATGGIFNVITRSGSNDWNGSVFGYLRPEALEGNATPLVLERGSVETTGSSVVEAGFRLGGPIARDRAFFFAALSPRWERVSRIAPEDAPLRSLGEDDRNTERVSYAAKASFFPSSSHRLDFSFFGNPSETDVRNLLAADTSGFTTQTFGGHNQTARYQAILRPDWLLEASFSHFGDQLEVLPTVDEWRVSDRTVFPPLETGGTAAFQDGATSFQYNVRSTHFAGSHEFRFGLQFEDIDYFERYALAGPSVTLANGLATGSGVRVVVLPDPLYGAIYRVIDGSLATERDTTQQYLSFFAQDSFSPGERVRISAGLRYDQEELAGNASQFRWSGNWAPRIGATWDAFANGRGKVFGNVAVYYPQIPNSLALLAMSTDTFVLRADYFDANLTRPIPDGVSALGTTRHLFLFGEEPVQFDPESKSTRLLEMLAGYEHELSDRASLEVSFLYRTMPRVLEDAGNAAAILYALDDPPPEDPVFLVTNPRRGFPATVGNVGAFEDPIHRYYAFEVTARKRFSATGSLMGSYRWSRLFGTYEGFYRNDNGNDVAALSTLFDFPTNDPSYTEIGVPEFGFSGDIRYLGHLGAGLLPNDRRHELKVFGAYVLESGLGLGFGVVATSGRPLTPMAADPITGSPGEIPLAPRATGIDAVDGFRTRTQFELEANFHVDYAFRLSSYRLLLTADVFNLFDLQQAVAYDQNYEDFFSLPNPDFGEVSAYQDPIRLRIGVRFEF